MNIALWITQTLLAATLIWAGFTKLFKQPAKLAAMWPWTANNRLLVTLTGVLDLLAAIGLILPALTTIYPILTAYTAIGIIGLMVAAIILHIARGEASQIGINIVFALVAVFIAWGRLQ